MIIEEYGLKDFLNEFKIYISNIGGVQNGLINKRRYDDFIQFREFFILDNQPVDLDDDNCFIKDIPLEENCTSEFLDIDKYWMNTPFK